MRHEKGQVKAGGRCTSENKALRAEILNVFIGATQRVCKLERFDVCVCLTRRSPIDLKLKRKYIDLLISQYRFDNKSTQAKICNCIRNETCPMQEKCLTEKVIDEATITTPEPDNTVKKNITSVCAKPL